MKKKTVILLLMTLFITVDTVGQVFTNDVWQQKNVLSVKVAQLFYETNIGININPQKSTADFVYMAFGYGRPTRKNAWRKFMPENSIPDGLPKSLQTKLSQASTNDLYAGKIAVGWNHWFNHTIGCYAQAGWGFIADLTTDDGLTDEERSLLASSKEKETFIYNTVPVELGLTLNMWQHYNVQAGFTYLWKEIPLLTVGIGYTF